MTIDAVLYGVAFCASTTSLNQSWIALLVVNPRFRTTSLYFGLPGRLRSITFLPLVSLKVVTSNSTLSPLQPVNQPRVSASISSAKNEPWKSASWVLASVIVASYLSLISSSTASVISSVMRSSLPTSRSDADHFEGQTLLKVQRLSSLPDMSEITSEPLVR